MGSASYAVGVDFGGTKISAGVVELSSGKLLGTGKKKTRRVQEEGDVIKRIAAVVDDAIIEANVDIKKIRGIGIGAAGMVDRQKGILLSAVNVGVEALPITDGISKHYGVPSRLGNDVEVATLGELSFGAGRDSKNFVCIFVGTGIGSGIVHNGQQYYGVTGTAGEIGHMVLFPDGRLCACGAYGCLETYASRTAVAKDILRDLDKGLESTLRDKVDLQKGILRSRAIVTAADSGDEVALRALLAAAQYMGSGLASVVNFYNPEKIILGGGLVEASEMYFEVAKRETKRKSLRIPGRKLEIVKAQLGDFAGIVGAALLVK